MFYTSAHVQARLLAAYDSSSTRGWPDILTTKQGGNLSWGEHCLNFGGFLPWWLPLLNKIPNIVNSESRNKLVPSVFETETNDS